MGRTVVAALLVVFVLAQAPAGAQADARARLQAAVDAFKAVDLAGQAVSVRDLRGRVVLIEFWATWCAPCLSDIPYLQQARKTYPDRLAILGVSLDVIDRAAFTTWLRRQGVDWTQVHDGRGWSSPLITPFGFDRLPFNILVAADGRIVGTDVRGEQLLRALDTLLQVPPPR